jgi:hypothetical protein
MKKIKIGFSKGHTLFSKLICLLDKSQFSHTFFSFHSNTLDRDIIYQSNLLGVNFINRENFLTHSDILAEIELDITEESYSKIMQFCIDKCGNTMYDFKGLLGKGLVRLGMFVNNPWDDKLKTVDCSELVNAVLAEEGIDTGLDMSIAGPKEIYQYLLDRQAPKAP